jgi:hypothetical protein
MKDTFSSAELTALRNDLIHDVLIDSREALRGHPKPANESHLKTGQRE